MGASARFGLGSVFFALTISAVACGAGESTESAQERELTAKREKSTSIYEKSIDDTEAGYTRCFDELEATGKCTVTNETTGKSLTIYIGTSSPQDWRDQLRKARQVLGQVRQLLRDAKTKMCEVLAPFAGRTHPYFFYGGNVNGGAGVLGQAGFDVVYDIWNQQAATFTYKGAGLGTLAGVEGGVYMGYGFGEKPNVIEAWSGRFCSVSASAGLYASTLEGIPLGAGVGGSLFSSPDQSIVGGSVGVSGSIGYTPPLVEGAVFAADWTPFNTGTQGLNNVGWGYRTDIQTDANGHQYIQYRSSVDMAIAVLWNVPTPQNVAVATQILAVDALKKTGLTIEQQCPQQVAAAKAREERERAANGKGVFEQVCQDSIDKLKDAVLGKGDKGLSKTDCADKTDGWWCLDAGGGPGWMAYCSGKQISGGCGCAGCTTAGVAASCSASPPPAACPAQ